jgi:hypothetical protein
MQLAAVRTCGTVFALAVLIGLTAAASPASICDAEEYVQRGRKHLPPQHRIHRRTRRVRSLDHVIHAAGDEVRRQLRSFEPLRNGHKGLRA